MEWDESEPQQSLESPYPVNSNTQFIKALQFIFKYIPLFPWSKISLTVKGCSPETQDRMDEENKYNDLQRARQSMDGN